MLPLFAARAWLMAGCSMWVAAPALAHHPTGGQMPDSALAGVLSGLAHPVIDVEHLVFLLAAAVVWGLSRLSPSRLAGVIALFVVASLSGALAHRAGWLVPWMGVGLAASLFGVAWRLLAVRSESPSLTGHAIWAAFCGAIHGYAYGEAVLGAEATPVLAYLLGLSVIQIVLMGTAAVAARRLCNGPRLAQFRVRLRGLALLAAAMGAWVLSVSAFH